MVADGKNDGKNSAQNPEKNSAEGVDDAGESAATVAEPSSGKLKRLLTVKVLAILVVLSFLVHGVGLTYSHFTRTKDQVADADTEISLGAFAFEANPAEQSMVAAAEFQLYIALIDDMGPQARQTLTQRQYRVKQNVEELLRQAHGGDFADPALGELKRQLQERINETLVMRAIADVIITDLRISRKSHEDRSSAETANSVPWSDEPSS